MIDILSCKVGTFTVDTTGPLEVPVTLVGDKLYPIFPNAAPYFDVKDNFVIQSVAISLPHSFCSGSNLWEFELSGLSSLGFYFDLPVSRTLQIPFENSEIDIGTFVPWDTNPGGDKWALFGQVVSGTISMVNVPASLNTKVLPVYLFAKVLHNLPLIA